MERGRLRRKGTGSCCFSRKRGASEASESERTKASMEAAPSQSVPKRTQVKAVPECLRKRAPPPPKRNVILQQRATKLGPPSDPAPEVERNTMERPHFPQCKGIGP